MHISKRVKVVAGVSALLGVVVAGGAAFTATGVSTVSQPAGTAQFVGGTISQAVSGTVLSDINYGFSDWPVDTLVNAVQIVFADTHADGSTVTAVLTDTAGSTNLNCDDVGSPTDGSNTNDTDTANTTILTTDFGGTETIQNHVEGPGNGNHTIRGHR